MAGPSGEAVGLIVGMGTVTIGAMWGTVGYFARHFLEQQRANHQDTLAVKSDVHEIKQTLPVLGFRISRLEAATVASAIVGAAYAWTRRSGTRL